MIFAAEFLYQALLNIVNKYYEVIVTDNLSEETINQFKTYRNGLIIVTPSLSKKQNPVMLYVTSIILTLEYNTVTHTEKY